MLGAVAAVAYALALSGCALISGPCSVEHERGYVVCEQGGVLVLWMPAWTITAAGEAAVNLREARAPPLPWHEMRPHEGP